MKSYKVLITGGGGFIGTQIAWELASKYCDVTIVDREVPVHYYPGVYKVSDYLDFFLKNDTLFDVVIHLAADHIVPASITKPSEYYDNNVLKMKTMLDLMVTRGMRNIIFSSSGNTYGRQGWQGFPLSEQGTYYDPENPYASTKVAGEMMIKDYARAYGMKYVTFRYFNAAGADPLCRFGYVQRPATHVIPILCKKILTGETFQIYGNEYFTKDGTCIRDYVHVKDLAIAHAKAVDYLEAGGDNETINVGGGSSGISVKELVDVAAEIVGKTPVVEYAPKREGDPAILVANIQKAKKVLNWEPQYNIKDIISHAWEWEKKLESDK